MPPRPAFFPGPPLRTTRRRRRQPPRCASSMPSPPPPPRLPPPPPPAVRTVDRLRVRAAALKCPFWRRRFGDALDGARQVVVWAVVARHKSLPLPLPLTPPGLGLAPAKKRRGLPLAERVQVIREDFVRRQYYVTGRLSAAIYADDCVFDGPDPDVPVTGLAKYVSAAAGLFDRRLSRVDLIAIEERGEQVVARWRLEGALNLPWKPKIKPYTGETRYSFDDDGLVVRHVETWSVSALDAFVSVLWPGFGAPPAPAVEVLLEEEGARAKAEDGCLREDGY